MKKEFINVSLEIILVKEDVILYSGVYGTTMNDLDQDNNLMSED